MEGIISTIRPKFEAIASEIEPTLSALTGDEMFTHVAQHARRTVNPPGRGKQVITISAFSAISYKSRYLDQ